MSTFARAVNDSATMLRRNLLHLQRYPSMTIMLIGQPILFLLLFVYVFGGTMGAGIADGGRQDYLAYITPGILLMTVASVSLSTSVSVAMDMAQGIMARFRTMDIARVSVLTGHVLGTIIQSALALAVVTGTALLLGFRPDANPLGWLAVAGLFVVVTLALTWLTVALGLVAKSVEAASNTPMILVLLPFLGSGFVPTDSMPAGLRWFAENQPFTPIIETTRGLLLGTPIGHHGALAVGWCLVIGLASYAWARHLFNRDPTATARTILSAGGH